MNRIAKLSARATAFAALALVIASVCSPPAGAQTLPAPTTVTSSTTLPATITTTSTTTPVPVTAPERRVAASDPVVPDDVYGGVPSSHYDIGCDEGAWNNVGRKLYCWFTDLAFQTARVTVAVSLWLVGWAYSFAPARALTGPASRLAAMYQARIVGPLGLTHLAWFAAVAWAAVAVLRGRAVHAARELTVSFVCAGLGVLLVANPAGYLDGATRLMADTATLLLAPDTTNPNAAADPVTVLRERAHRAFVEDPYDALNWGGPLTGPCAGARNQILADGPHGSDDEPRDRMRDAGCADQADFNARPSAERLFAALLTLTAAAVAAVLFAAVAFTLVTAQVLAAVLLAAGPFAVVSGILPGWGRDPAVRWVAGLARTVVAVAASSFVLSILLISVDGLLTATDGTPLLGRFGLVDALVAAMFIVRRKILGGGRHLTDRAAATLTSRPTGGPASGWPTGRDPLLPAGTMPKASIGVGVGPAQIRLGRR